MVDPKIFDDITKKLCDVMPEGFKTVQHELERNFHTALQSAFNKLDLITREEFDVQAGVLAKTRTKLEILEIKLADLEKQLGKAPSKVTRNTKAKSKPSGKTSAKSKKGD